MTIKQKALKIFYPLLMKLSGATSKKLQAATPPQVPFQSLSVTLNSGKHLTMDTLKGKKILVVNTASNCGFTAQYAELQKLYEQYNGTLEIIGFPANDFREQEKGSDADIAEFCQVNFGVQFPLAKKSSVIAGPAQNPVFNWLTDKTKNGWNTQQPTWNFAKFLVNEKGMLTHYFDPSVSPLSQEVLAAIQS